jgi:hypothetical protein
MASPMFVEERRASVRDLRRLRAQPFFEKTGVKSRVLKGRANGSTDAPEQANTRGSRPRLTGRQGPQQEGEAS